MEEGCALLKCFCQVGTRIFSEVRVRHCSLNFWTFLFTKNSSSLNRVHCISGSMNRVHLKSGSSKLVHLESASSKLVHQKSGSLKSVHWKSCSGDVHSPKI